MEENIFINSKINNTYLDGYVIIISAVVLFLAAFFIQQRLFFFIQFDPKNIIPELTGLTILLILTGFMLVTIVIAYE
jgi:hypothetical protein